MSKSGTGKILVVAAHPDDEILGCGATTAKHAQAGDTVYTLILGEGVASRAGLKKKDVAAQQKKLQAACRKANAVLGVQKVITKNFPDNRFDGVDLLDIIHSIEEVIAGFKPDTIYTHSPTDLNIDHQLVSEAVRTACRPLPDCSVRRLYAFEVPSATEWRFDPAKDFRPNRFVDVATTLDLKIAALREYDGEMRDFPHPRSEKYIRALAHVRGGQTGREAAEAFSVIREIAP